MIDVHLLSEEVVKYCRFQNEIIGVHLLLVGTSSVLVCMIGVHLLSVRTSNIVTHDWCTFTSFISTQNQTQYYNTVTVHFIRLDTK